MHSILAEWKAANIQVLGLLSFIHGMAAFRFPVISPLEKSGRLVTVWQPEVSPRTAWEALVARSPEVVAAMRTTGSLSCATLGTPGLQRALV